MIDAERHRAEVEAWRERRYESLRRDTGWLTLAGLGWLHAGENVIGTDPAADVVLPDGPALAGTITVADDRVSVSGTFRLGGRPVVDLPLISDADGEPTLLELGDLRLCLIDRDGRLAVRTWDLASAMRRAFEGIDHWPVDPAWRLDARLEPTPGRVITVPDVFGGVKEEESPGDIAFDVRGEALRLQVLRGGDRGELWLIFGDATNGHETYGGGRYLYTDAPDAEGRVTVDFNRAYNPPCVFSHYATCSLPWGANRLPIRIEAGERAYDPAH